MSIAEAFAVISIMVVGILAIERILFVLHRQVCVKRLYLAALDEAFEEDRVGLIHVRTKTPSLRKFR